MLVLTRGIQQSLLIGDDIKVTILSVVGGQVRIGIDAPKHMPVDREEIREKKDLEKNGNYHG